MPVLISLIVVCASLFLAYVIRLYGRPPGYPPGPAWVPIVGNLPELRKLAKKLGGQHLALWKLAEQYDTKVLGLRLGGDYVVTVFSYDVVKQVLLGEEFDGRPDNFFIKLRCMGARRGVTCTDGPLWKAQRNFVITHLKDLGFGRNTMELMIKEEVVEILEVIHENSGEVQIRKLLAPSVINILWRFTSGTRFGRDDPQLGKILDLLYERTKAFDMSGGTLSQHPWLRYIAPEKTGYNLIKRINSDLKNLMMTTIKKHFNTWVNGKNEDLIYAYINEIKTANGNKTVFTEEQLLVVCLDIFIAGAQTTSSTLDFIFLVMILYPEIQKKVHSCIDEAFRKDDTISYQDRVRIPYIEAVILEIERYYAVVTIAGPRRVLKNTILEGYQIPKETTVLISLHSVHFDKDYWKDPEVFRPERFLDNDGKIFNYERVITFGLGRRRCPGEILAKHSIFLIFVELMRKYNISLWPGSKQPTGIPIPGITITPEMYRAQFTPR